MRKRLIPELALLFSAAISVGAQVPPKINQTARRSVCANIVALSGAKIDCRSLTPAQSKALEEIPAILKMALLNQKYFDSIKAELDEISRQQNAAPTFNCQQSNCGNNLTNPQVNVYGPRIPTFLGLEEIAKDGRGYSYPAEDKDGHALTHIKFYADASWDDPRIEVDCDRPCTAYGAEPYTPTIVLSPTFQSASSPSFPASVVFLFQGSLRPMAADTYYVLTLASSDAVPVKIVHVAAFLGRIAPH